MQKSEENFQGFCVTSPVGVDAVSKNTAKILAEMFVDALKKQIQVHDQGPEGIPLDNAIALISEFYGYRDRNPDPVAAEMIVSQMMANLREDETLGCTHSEDQPGALKACFEQMLDWAMTTGIMPRPESVSLH